jgi:hypothetical protein
MYGTIAGWRAYAGARGDDKPAEAADTAATAALTRASDYIRFRYVANLLSDYGMEFTPPGSALPLIEEAAYIAASYELLTPGFFSKTYTASEQKVLTEVKGIRWTVTGDSSKTYSSMPTSSLIDALFGPYVSDPDAPSFGIWAIGSRACR